MKFHPEEVISIVTIKKLIYWIKPFETIALCICVYFKKYVSLLVSIFCIRYTSLKHTFCCLFFIKRSVLSYFHLDRHFHFQSQGNKSYTLGMKNTRMGNREWTTFILPSLPLARHHTVYVRLSEACLAPPPLPPTKNLVTKFTFRGFFWGYKEKKIPKTLWMW